MRVTADNFSDRERAEAYFRTNPHDDRVVIVYLCAENQGSDATWLFTQDAMWLTDDPGTTRLNAHDQRIEGDYAAGDAVGIAGAAMISLPMMFATGSFIWH